MAPPTAVIDAYLQGLEGDVRRVAEGEWGLSVEAGGWPLHVGVAIRDGLLRAQAQVAEPGALDPESLLRWNRQVPLVGFGLTQSGEVWIAGDLPLRAVDSVTLDRFLGLLVRVAHEAREGIASG
jgi:Putative bacterial sensory transduction regulator